MTSRLSVPEGGATRAELDFPTYLADREFWTSSSLKHAAVWTRTGPVWTPQRFRAWLDKRLPEKKTADLEFGTATHAAIVGELGSVVAIAPEDASDRRTKAWKEWVKAQEPGRIFLTAAEGRQIAAIYDAIMRHPVVQLLLNSPIIATEGTVLWHPDQGLVPARLKCRPDLETAAAIIDWKTSANALDWAGDAYEYGYHRQACIQQMSIAQLEGVAKPVYHVVVSKDALPDVVVYQMDEAMLEQGRTEVVWIVREINEWASWDAWEPAYSRTIQPLSLPPWAR